MFAQYLRAAHIRRPPSSSIQSSAHCGAVVVTNRMRHTSESRVAPLTSALLPHGAAASARASETLPTDAHACVGSLTRSLAPVCPCACALRWWWLCSAALFAPLAARTDLSAGATETARVRRLCARTRTHIHTHTSPTPNQRQRSSTTAATCVRSACLHSQSVAERRRQQYTQTNSVVLVLVYARHPPFFWFSVVSCRFAIAIANLD